MRPMSPRTAMSSLPWPAGDSVRSASRAGGQVASARHSPRISARSGAGRVERRAKTAIGGSTSMPLRSSRSQRPNQRISSGTRSMCGPGSDVCRATCAPTGRSAARFGQRERLEAAEGDVRVPVRPAGDEHRRAGDAVVVRAHRAVTPVRAVNLLLEPPQEPRLGALDAAQPLVRASRRRTRAGPVEARCTRPCRAPNRRGRRPSERAAHVVDVVRVAVVGGVDRARSLRARADAGRRPGAS